MTDANISPCQTSLRQRIPLAIIAHRLDRGAHTSRFYRAEGDVPNLGELDLAGWQAAG
jgi:hypothetical protein